MISEMSMYRYTSIRAPARLVSSPTEKQRSYPRPNIRGGGSSGLQVFVQPIVSLCGDVFQCSTLETWSDFCQAYFGQVAESCLLRGDKSKASQSTGLESAAGRRKRERKENEEGKKTLWLYAIDSSSILRRRKNIAKIAKLTYLQVFQNCELWYNVSKVKSLKDHSLKVFSNVFVIVVVIVIVFVFVVVFLLVRSCFHITMIKCLKGQKSQRSLFKGVL